MNSSTNTKSVSGMLASLFLKQKRETAVVAHYPPQQTGLAAQPAGQKKLRDEHVSIIKRPQINEFQSMQLTAALADLLDNSLSAFELDQQCGRVFLIRFVPLRRADPLLPFVFRQYGRGYKRSYQKLTDMLISQTWSLAPWRYRKARREADALIKYVLYDDDMLPAEKLYYQTRMLYAVAMPQKAI